MSAELGAGRARRAVAVRILIFAALVLGAWLALKVHLFTGLEYVHDLFSHLQLARGWVSGRPLDWENDYGPARLGHNYLLTPLLGPVAHAFGPYGLFGVHALLLFAAFAVAARDGAWRFAAYLFGPTGLWLWDDPRYGWHVELLSVPLAVLFASAWSRGSRAGVWAAGAALALLREDGAVLGCALALLLTWRSRPGGSDARALLRVIALWLAVFLVGLAWQRHEGAFASQRLSGALEGLPALATEPGARAAIVRGLATALVLFAAGLALAPSPRAVAMPAALAALPLLVVALVGAAAYPRDPVVLEVHGVGWGPRFAPLWGLVAGALVPAAWPGEGRARASEPAPARPGPWTMIGASVVLQLAALAFFRPWEAPTTRAAQILRGRVVASSLSPRERALLECLGRSLARDAPVAANERLFAFFWRQEPVWPEHLDHAWAAPRAAVCDRAERFPPGAPCRSAARDLEALGARARDVDALRVTYAPELGDAVERCFPPADPVGRAVSEVLSSRPS